MARRRRRPQVERKIYFYRVDAGQDDGARPLPFNPRTVLQHIDSLAWNEDGRYMFDAEDNALCCWVDRSAAPQRLRFGISRRSGLPLLEQRGRVGPLNISAAAGLAELVHVVFFPDNIVGSEFNFYGPRVPRLRFYFEEKARQVCPPVAFEPLLRQDVLEQLRRLRQIRVMDLKIRVPFIEAIRAVDEDIGTALDVAARAGEAEEVELVLRPAAYHRGFLSDRVTRLIRALARRDDLRENARLLRVTGFDTQLGHMVQVDVLSDYLVSSKRIIRQAGRSRALDMESAYAAIEEAHAELAPDLRRAAAVRP
ncbi:MAG TPA: hypothetical protein VGQ06_06045 [Gemmatimonadales bacterium]|jgi:hypothetical protein|nr:hypothetical protein [Gemmatimonadales bacterium]